MSLINPSKEYKLDNNCFKIKGTEMKKGLFVIFLMLIMACESNKEKQREVKVKEENAISDLSMKPFEGKYLAKENAFAKEPLKSRLSQLMGKQFDDLLKYWNTESPLVQEGNVFHAGGCKAHDCSTISYDLYIDKQNNTINLYQFKNGNQRVFKEKEKIELPEGFAKELEVKRQNATLQSLPGINKP